MRLIDADALRAEFKEPTDCDQCGETMQWYDPDSKPNYCPECGADMRG